MWNKGTDIVLYLKHQDFKQAIYDNVDVCNRTAYEKLSCYLSQKLIMKKKMCIKLEKQNAAIREFRT